MEWWPLLRKLALIRRELGAGIFDRDPGHTARGCVFKSPEAGGNASRPPFYRAVIF